MSEQLPAQDDWKARLFAYFLPEGRNPARRAALEQRGLIPTNNLSLYIVDDPATEILPDSGIRNPFDYRQRPFGPMLERLRADYPDLWEEAKTTARVRGELMNQIGTTASTQELFALIDAAELAQQETYTRVIETIAPWLLEAGIDPIDVCR